jgi:hypothetical protein
MGSDADTFLIDTSAGQLRVPYGWNEWVTVDRAGAQTRSAVVRGRGDLERLLAEAGVPEAEAAPHARRLWSDRPTSGSRGEGDPWEPPWKRHSNGTLVMFLLGLAIVVIAIVGFKVDWVGV